MVGLENVVLTLLKYSTPECPICAEMADFDSRIAEDLGLAYVVVDMRTPEIYGRYRAVLLQHYPLKQELQLPTYILVDEPEGDFRIHGAISGGLPESAFRSRLEALMPDTSADA